ncbi:MAG: UDP-3-O-(3-hydroxymyristoyl)glucosamine N-acyltransferase [Planctomycetota bacterium]|jgi:UDP-3-O-[3-hydroxymyristoyl] glucosamine N-acyltransferase
MLEFSAEDLARLVTGRLVGAGDVTIANVSSLASAGPGDLAFLREEADRPQAEASAADILLTPVELDGFPGAQVICEDVDVALATVLDAFARERFAAPRGVSPLASVHEDASLGREVAVGNYAVVGAGATIGDGAVIHPLAYVGAGCRIGARTVVRANASLHDGVVVGEDCIIHYGAVIGSEGFGFVQREGRHVKLSQVGTVRIGNRVEVGALSTVDRAMLDATVIEDGVKMDNHCHVAHNCHIGPDCILAGYARLAGSVRLGRGVICAEDVAISDHVTVGDGAILGAKSGVVADVASGAVVLGIPARPIALQRRIWAHEGRLPEMARRLRHLEKQVEELARKPQDDA